MCKVSVIVPVYNVERYLKRCVNSIINQTYNDFELLLVDDGSTDLSGKICDELKQADQRIKVFHKKNGGLSDARNYGLQFAKGKYITFIDSDDFVSADYIDILYNSILDNSGVDISTVSVFNFSDENLIKGFNLSKRKFETEVVDTKIAVKKMLLNDNISHEAWGKMYSKDLWDNIQFPFGQMLEDYSTTYKIFSKANKVAINNVKTYYYYQRSGSILRCQVSEKTLEVFDISDKETVNIINTWPDLKTEAKALQITTYLKFYQKILNSDFSLYPEYQKRIKKMTKKNSIILLKSPVVNYKLKIKIILAMLNKRLFLLIYNKFGEK